ncbi:hemin ABC transporter substrate-binding protein [Rhodobacter xanthinilyticus]|uniref:Hemin ABC transporter substrate-binding protein n=1 Tax=Rhodobacter xanthinilyticus TaxID=1850250 RepID=A0A1D9MBD6_9RHOB|nr:ABC transporter substrate-binding protein [Rhodobacter xanthinilyticus]AOZ69143.1 hemin ABC transporter substrate-binding protein [Rhodobacter xanthinilyticus]
MIRAGLIALLLWPALARAEGPGRVLSVGGGVTEIVYALGEEARLVGRDTTSTFPPAAAALPDVGYMRQLSPEGMLSVAPDLILLSAGAGPAETLETLGAAGVAMVTIPEGITPQAVTEKVAAVAAALGVSEKGAELNARLAAEMAAAQAAVAAEPGPAPKVLFILGNSGGRLTGAGAGTAAQAMIDLAGGENAITGFSGYKALTDEAIAAAAPDVLLVMDRGDGGASEGATEADYLAHPALAATPAGRAGAIVRMPGMFLLGFGPRTPEAITALHRALFAKAR